MEDDTQAHILEGLERLRKESPIVHAVMNYARDSVGRVSVTPQMFYTIVEELVKRNKTLEKQLVDSIKYGQAVIRVSDLVEDLDKRIDVTNTLPEQQRALVQLKDHWENKTRGEP